MPEYLRTLVVILFIATLTFAFAKKAIGPIVTNERFNRWHNAWFVITLIAFLSHNFWVYIVASGLFITYASKRESNKTALFFLFLFTVPSIGLSISGFGIANYLFEINHLRLLSLVILLPAFLSLLTSRDNLPLGKNWPDKLILAYLILSVLLQLRDTTVTDTLRQGFYAFTDIFLPYYVASRALKKYEQLEHAISAFVIASFIVAAIGLFEFTRHWLLYNPLTGIWEIYSGVGGYLDRGDNLRALASLGQPIVLGYVMVVAMGLYLFLKQSIRSKNIQRIGLALLALGLIAPLSRGPWVGAAVLLIIFVATGPNAIKRLALLGMAALLAFPLLSIVPGGEKVINLLPFIGNTEKANIDYRDKLIDNSMIVIKRYPWFGSVNYLETPEMQEMIQGQGIIDIVNTYIQVSLYSGLVGLSLFAGFFLTVLYGINQSRKKILDKANELHLLGRSLTATLIAVLVMIVTVSSISVIPIVYWSLAGLGVAYTGIVKRTKNPQKIGITS